MAKFKSILGIVSGKLGAQVFNNNGTVRQFAMPTNPRTPEQQAQRNTSTALVQAWKDLSVDTKSAWNSIVGNWPYVNSVGDTKYYSGYQLFMHLNGPILALDNTTGLPTPATTAVIAPPAGKPSTTNPGLTIGTTVVAGVVTELNITNAVATTITEQLLIRTTPVLSNGITFVNPSAYRTIGYISNGSTPATTNVISLYNAKFGTWNVGGQVGIEVGVLDISTGAYTIIEQLLSKPV